MTKYEAAGHTAFTAERQQEMNPGAVLAFSLSKKKKNSFFCSYGCFVCTRVCVPRVGLVYTEARKRL